MIRSKYLTLDCLFYVFIFVYAFLIVFKSNFGVIDDSIFCCNFFKGKLMGFTILSDVGRFLPLYGFEANLLSFFSLSPRIFYFYNALQFIVIAFLLYKILFKICNNKLIVFSILFIFFLSPGFVSNWLRIFISERPSFFCFVVFLYFYIKFQERQKIIYFVLCLCLANIALYFKEAGFVMLGTFSFFHLIFEWGKSNKKQKLFDSLLLLSSVVFIVLYFFIVYINRGETLYGQDFVKTFFFNFSLVVSYLLNDPLLFLNFVLFFAWRVPALLSSKIKFDSFYDSLSISAIAFMFVFFILRLYNPCYMLPAYVFALPALIFYFSNANWREKIFLKIASVTTLFIIVFSSLPAGIHWFSFYKNIPHNYQKTLDFLEPYIKEKFKNGERTNIFLYGIYRNSNSEVYSSFMLFLCEYKKLPTKSFDLKTDIKFNKNHCPNENLPYSFWNKREIDKIEKGDLLIVTPYTYKNFYKDSFDEYETIFRTNSSIVIPDISLRAIIKYIVSNYIRKNSNNPGMYSNKFLGLPQDFYVLRKIR